MEIKILNEDKSTMDVELDNLTIAELLRVYLNKEGVKFAAWRRENPEKNPILHIEVASGSPKAIVKKAIASVTKELDKLDSDFKKLK